MVEVVLSPLPGPLPLLRERYGTHTPAEDDGRCVRRGEGVRRGPMKGTAPAHPRCLPSQRRPKKSLYVAFSRRLACSVRHSLFARRQNVAGGGGIGSHNLCRSLAGHLAGRLAVMLCGDVDVAAAAEGAMLQQEDRGYGRPWPG